MRTPRPRLLILDDEQAVLTLLGAVALDQGFDVATTVDGADAMQLLQHRPADLVLVDLRMPGVSGLDVLRAIREISSRPRVVLMSGNATIDSAVEAVRLGAMDYLTKPFDLARFRQLLTSVREEIDQRRAVLAVDAELAERLEFCGMIGRGPAMQDVFALIRRLAPHARMALVTGETGTGKELTARALHQMGPRRARRFVTVNCSAIVETLFESELFGHVRGAFTGAADHKVGVFESADGGTLFLDEIGELPLAVQAKLLRVIENGEVQRVGGTDTRTVDVRVIAATNRDLPTEVAAGRFRADLYYRLNIAEVMLPPLRERTEDIPYLTAAFVRAFSDKFQKPLAGVTPRAERLLSQQPWAGNVRELRNALERASMLAEGDLITDADLGSILQRSAGAFAASKPGSPGGAVARARRLRRDDIVEVMARVRGNKVAAARLLGLSRRALYRQLERHGLGPSASRTGTPPAGNRPS